MLSFVHVLGQPYSLASFGLWVGFERLANVYGCEALGSFRAIF